MKPNDCKRHYVCHGFGAFDRVQIKCKIPEYTNVRRKVPTTYTPKYWIWFNVDRDDPRGLSHRNACPRPFTPHWDYCKKHGFNNLAEMNSQNSLSVQPASFVTPISSRTRQAPPRVQTS